MSRVTRMPRAPVDRSRGLAEVQALAWLLDNSIPVPGTGGRRFGIDALIGFVPIVGDLVSGGIGLFVVWRGSQLKANTRNLALIRRHLEDPDTSTAGEWLVLFGLVGVLVLIVVLIGWFVVSIISAVAGALG